MATQKIDAALKTKVEWTDIYGTEWRAHLDGFGHNMAGEWLFGPKGVRIVPDDDYSRSVALSWEMLDRIRALADFAPGGEP